jgi:hypothetical protein
MYSNNSVTDTDRNCLRIVDAEGCGFENLIYKQHVLCY